MGVLSELGPSELLERLQNELSGWGEAEALDVLANPHASEDVLRVMIAHRGLLASYRVKKALVLDRRAPIADALRLVSHLRWRDLMHAGQNPRVLPQVRRAADRHLAERVPELALGERISLAKSCGREILLQLRSDPDPMVFRALLDNPRLVEDDLASGIATGRCLPRHFPTIARNPRWGCRTQIRVALARHPETPPPIAVGLLGFLPRTELEGLARRPGVAPLVKEAIRQRLEDGIAGPSSGARRG